jgi:ATP-dependent helicase/nuclease subunit B
MSLKLIPQTLDQVLVGSIERSRHPELKAVFLAGVTQKQFPLPLATDTILSDEDKSVAGEALDLGDGLVEQLSARQYLAYIAFTRPSEYLHISYPLADAEGKPATGSPFLSNLSGLFDDLKIESSPQRRGTVADRLCAGFGAGSNGLKEDGKELAGMLIESDCPKAKRTGQLLKYSLSYDNAASMDRDVLMQNDAWFVKDNKLECSTTRLSSFAACPYKHFGEYVLKLKRRDTMEFAPMDMGSFYHKALDGIAKELLARSLDFGSADTDELQNICKQQIAGLLEKDPSIGNFARQSAFNNYIITSAYDIIVDAVNAYAQIARAGEFKLAESEVRFGFSGSKAQCRFTLQDGTQVILRGVIDRLDIAQIDGKLTGLVFDYKRKDKNINFTKLANKLDMQLEVYMLAAKSIQVDGKAIDDIAGAFYLPIQIPTQEGSLDSPDDRKFEYKAKGIFSGAMSDQLHADANRWSEFYNFYAGKDGPYGNFRSSGAVQPEQFRNILEFVERSIRELSSNIVAGSIEITPYRIGKSSPCSWCDMRPVCRFDWQINKYNKLEPEGKQEFLDRLEVAHE